MTDDTGKDGAFSAWWASPPQELASQIDTSLSEGLESEQVEEHRRRYGSNQLEDRGPTSLWTLAWESIRSPMMVLLLSIAGISLLLGQMREAIVMVFVVAMYVGVHLLNKARADRTMARLRQVQAPTARVLREGQIREIPTRDLVVGDVLPLQAGTRVAADGRLIEAAGLLVDESALTGEASPVRKDAGAQLDPDTSLAERVTAVFAGTTVQDGQGQKGTDVAREAADLILTDDNLAHLADGVAIGRKAYDNFDKGITYYLSAKAILLSIFVVPLMVGIAFPLAPIQIIFTELLMDLASSTIFISEEAEPDLLKRKPRPRTGFLSWQVLGRIVRNSAGLVTAILVVYFGSLALGYGIDSARTAAFATWLLGHIVLAMNLKQRRRPLLQQGLLANRFAFGWLVGMILLVLAMTFLEPVRSLLKTTPLSGIQWLGVVVGSVAAGGWMEIVKQVQDLTFTRC